MRLRVDRAFRRCARVLVVLALAISACTASLAPSYDPALVGGLNAANEEALVLISEVSDGASAARYPTLAPKYDAVIGKFDALRLRADARDVPVLGRRLAGRVSGGGRLAEICGDDAAACVNASPGSLAVIVENFERLKRENRENGVSALEVAAFKNAYETSVEQALVVETALQR